MIARCTTGPRWAAPGAGDPGALPKPPADRIVVSPSIRHPVHSAQGARCLPFRLDIGNQRLDLENLFALTLDDLVRQLPDARVCDTRALAREDRD